jgi:ATP-dependent Clp protease ATP-binding subunit ClpA
VVQRRLLDPLSLALLEGKFLPGDRIQADVEKGEVVFHKK